MIRVAGRVATTKSPTEGNPLGPLPFSFKKKPSIRAGEFYVNLTQVKTHLRGEKLD